MLGGQKKAKEHFDPSVRSAVLETYRHQWSPLAGQPAQTRGDGTRL